MEKLTLLYEGKGKKLYTTNDANRVIAEFKDDLTAFNAHKKGSEAGKGSLNCQISSILFKLLEKNNIKTHFVEMLDCYNMLCKKVKIIPLEVVVRNIATGSLTKRLGIKDGEKLKFPLVEFYYKNDLLNDPILNDEHCKIINIVDNDKDINYIKDYARKINDILISFFMEKNLKLVDFKIEFGRDENNEIILSDEISPDSCRLWDKDTNKKMDKDIFRQSLGNVSDAYKEVLNRIK
ncbi:phosphoribosylaminoimidazolesuccinocarboxamide synthase [Helicobacter sp. MIT 14-3879]|uniref:phosphoribosylaminoimidazolesuccinocarboxamide synthase n=1 Tax=Helicobacter sp. MIT 14-3879 TaxID=2040649 RepID=UPI000E1ED9D3|nr:phosphoribosylaminoimidazolesuccinocarboxamide synthase [Helicobacter sp. MIT 14-3879]RDU62090.1 phosphoribosylaminoimidazolesuccinocarboxamide synthase [Helicobacter sp. MIT 14-3879]